MNITKTSEVGVNFDKNKMNKKMLDYVVFYSVGRSASPTYAANVKFNAP